jgi:hypothetical protein
VNVSNNSIIKESKVRNLYKTQLHVFFNTRLVFLCMPLRYTSERVQRVADSIEMNVLEKILR